MPAKRERGTRRSPLTFLFDMELNLQIDSFFEMRFPI